MPLKKDYKFSDRLISLSQIAFALSHPARIEIIEFLLENGKSSYSDLIDLIPLSTSSISQHLRALEKVCLIQNVDLDNASIGYKLHDKGFSEAWEEIGKLIKIAA